MLIKPNMSKDEILLKMADEINQSPICIRNKIAALIKLRRENHDNYEIQNKCSEYLTKLYDEKYIKLSRGENIR